MRYSLFLLVFFALFFQGCSRVRTLNLHKHQYSRTPQRIIWIQVAGLRPQHLSMIKFSRDQKEKRVSMEKSDCMGTLWNYNLFKIRPKASEGFLSQILGSKNIQNSCKDFSHKKPFWDRIGREEYRVGVFDTGNSGSFYDKSRTCSEQAAGAYVEDTTFWRMQPPNSKQSQTFHYQSKKDFAAGEVYFDQSCKNKEVCYASIYNNVTSVWKRFSQQLSRSVLIVQDFSYLKALQRGDLSRAREILSDIEKLYAYFLDVQRAEKGTLVLLSSSESKGLELPYKGASWANFENFGKEILYKRNTLNSYVYASGASAENFCGQYTESELAERILWKPEEKEFFLFNI